MNQSEKNQVREVKTIERVKYHSELDRALESINSYSGFGTITFSVYEKKIVNCKPLATKDLSK